MTSKLLMVVFKFLLLSSIAITCCITLFCFLFVAYFRYLSFRCRKSQQKQRPSLPSSKSTSNITKITTTASVAAAATTATTTKTTTNSKNYKKDDNIDDTSDSNTANNDGIVVGFFHPYCSSGGGGERVLWKMIQVLRDIQQQQENNNNNSNHDSGTVVKNSRESNFRVKQVVIYTIDDKTPQYKEKLLKNVHDRFAVPIFPSSSDDCAQNKEKDVDSKPGPVFDLQFVHLSQYKYLLEPARSLSLFVESIGSMRLAYFALKQSMKQSMQCSKNDKNSDDERSQALLPDLFIDTMGCSFTYIPAYLLFGCYVMPYVHYPTISTDMLQLVWERRPMYNNQNCKNSILLTYIKLIYYALFAIVYGIIGSTCCTVVLVNSTWTYNHIASLWRFGTSITSTKKNSERIQIVYPPCNVQDLLRNNNQIRNHMNTIPPNNGRTTNNATTQTTTTTTMSSNTYKRVPAIVSIGQFRPEKDHALQLQALAKLFELYPDCRRCNHRTSLSNCKSQSTDMVMKKDIKKDDHDNITYDDECNDDNDDSNKEDCVQLVLIGSCRSAEDEMRLEELRNLSRSLQISDSVQFIVNQPYSVVQKWLWKGTVGIHTMWNEHFGIGIVEMMAAGLLTIAHNSGGPKLDIVDVGVTGFLATTATEYASCIHQALQMSHEDAESMRSNAQKASLRFSDEVFEQTFRDVLVNNFTSNGNVLM